MASADFCFIICKVALTDAMTVCHGLLSVLFMPVDSKPACRDLFNQLPCWYSLQNSIIAREADLPGLSSVPP